MVASLQRSARVTGPLVLGTAVVIAGQAVAQGSGGSPQRLEPIRVTSDSGLELLTGYVPEAVTTGTKTDTPIAEVPQSMTVISARQIEDQGAGSVEEALQYVPGVVSQPWGRDRRFNQFNVRGFSGTTTGATYSDGLQVAMGDFAAPRLEPYGQERIEILRGPSSVLYGAWSPGGVVNMVSKRPPRAPMAELGLEYGNHDWRQARFDVGGPLTDTASVSGRLTGLVRDAGTIVDHSQDDKVFLAPALVVDLGDYTELTLLASYQKEDQFSFGTLPIAGTLESNPHGTIDREFFVGDPNYDTFETERMSLGYALEHRFSDRFMVRQNARYARVTNEQAVLYGAALQSDQRTLDRTAFTVDDSLAGWTVDNQAQLDLEHGDTRHRLLAGLEYRRREADNLRGAGAAPSIDLFDPAYGVQVSDPPAYLDNDITQDQVGVYLQDQIRAFDNLQVTLGLRHDRVDQQQDDALTGTTTDVDDSETTYRAGVGYTLAGGVTPYASYSESFQPILGSDENGDPFSPETARQYELGVKVAPPGLEALFTGSVYELTEQNVRSPHPDDPNLTVQGGEVRSRGLELSAQGRFLDTLDVTLAYTYTDAKVTEGTNSLPEGNEPPVTPAHTASAWANYRVPEGTLQGVIVGGGLRYTGESKGDGDNDIINPDHTVVDARIGYQWQGVEMNLRARNLTDRDYVVCNGSSMACSYGSARRVIADIAYRW